MSVGAGFRDAFLAFTKGSPPPERTDAMSYDDFQEARIVWAVKELTSLRALVWVVVLMHVAQWMGPAVGY